MTGVFLLFVPILIKVFYDVRLLLNWKKISISSSHQNTPITILISFRDEAENIHSLIKALKRQNYPKDLMRLIMIDDGSADDSFQQVEHEIENIPFQCEVIQLPSVKGKGKKAALRYALERVTTDWVLCTDADCQPQENWVSSMLPAVQERIGMVVGGVFYDEGTFLQQLQSIEQHALMFLTLSSAKSDHPLMANGASMLFRKSLYPKKDNGLATGDDIFLLESIKKTDFKILGQELHQNNIVITRAKNSVKEMFSQKKRWASKAFRIKDRDMRSIGFLQVFGHISVLGLLLFAFVLKQPLWMLPVFVKWIIEIVSVQMVGNSVNRAPSIFVSLLVVVSYSVFFFFLGIICLKKGYSWKSRNWAS